MASHEDTAESLGSASGSLQESNAHRTYKSFKRKFAKMKIKFELAMKEGNSLMREELRILELSKRLKEQNDQMLELLLDLNSSIHISPNLRFELNVLPPDLEPPPTWDPKHAQEQLRDARLDLLRGRITAHDCRKLEESISLAIPKFHPAHEYLNLIKSRRGTSNHDNTKPDEDLYWALGFLTPDHDMEYTNNLDSGVGFTRTGNRPTTADKEREIIIRNPTSMYNWLRKHEPNVFQDSESVGMPEKPSAPTKAAATRTSKRAAAQASKEDKMFEDESYMLDLEPEVTKGSSRGKRKRDEDGGYRPKGGSSGRSRKKKEDAPKRRKAAAASTS